MKRSNRLFIVAGILLAAVAFVGVLLVGGGGGTPPAPATVPVVVAAADIPLGTLLTADMLATAERPPAEAEESYGAPEEVVNMVVRRTVLAGQVIRPMDFETEAVANIAGSIPAGLRAVAVPLDDITGVALLIQPGDYVDVMLAVRDEVPLNEPYSDGDGLNPIIGPSVEDPNVYENKDGLVNSTSVKLIVQNVQVLSILRPTDTEPSTRARADYRPDAVAILAVLPQQAEMVRFAQLDGNISLLLRAPGDRQAAEAQTSGVTLRLLVDQYGVLPPGPVTLQPIVPYQPLP